MNGILKLLLIINQGIKKMRNFLNHYLVFFIIIFFIGYLYVKNNKNYEYIIKPKKDYDSLVVVVKKLDSALLQTNITLFNTELELERIKFEKKTKPN